MKDDLKELFVMGSLLLVVGGMVVFLINAKSKEEANPPHPYKITVYRGNYENSYWADSYELKEGCVKFGGTTACGNFSIVKMR